MDLLVDGLTRRIDHGPDLALGEAQVDPDPFAVRQLFAVGMGQGQKPLGEPGRQIQKSRILDDGAGPAHACAEQAEHVDGEPGVLLQEWDEVLAVHRQQFTIFHRRSIGRAGAIVEQRDLAEQGTGLENIEQDFPIFRAVVENANPAAKDPIETLAEIALAENDRSFGHASDQAVMHDAIESADIEVLEKEVPREQLALVASRSGDHDHRAEANVPVAVATSISAPHRETRQNTAKASWTRADRMPESNSRRDACQRRSENHWRRSALPRRCRSAVPESTLIMIRVNRRG